MTRRVIVFDIILLAVYLASNAPGATGIPAHEWTGLVAVVLLAAHCIAHGLSWKARGTAQVLSLVLNIAILAALVATAISGVMVSGTVLPALGLYAQGYYFWDPFHAMVAKVLLACLLVHVALNAMVAYRAWMKDGEKTGDAPPR